MIVLSNLDGDGSLSTWGPPLSPMKTMMLFANNPVVLSAWTMSPIISSVCVTFETMTASIQRASA